MNELYRRWLLSKEAYLKGTDAMVLCGIAQTTFYNTVKENGIKRYRWGYCVDDLIKLFGLGPTIKKWDRTFQSKLKELQDSHSVQLNQVSK